MRFYRAGIPATRSHHLPFNIAALAVWFVCVLLCGSADAGVTQVTRSDERGFEAVISIDPSEVDWVKSTDSLWEAFTTLQLGIPPGTRGRLVLAEGVESILRLDAFHPDRSLASGPLVRVGQPVRTRDRYTVGVRIYPVSGDQCYRTVRVSIAFDGTANRASRPLVRDVSEHLFASALANFDVARNWRLEEGSFAQSGLPDGPFGSGATWFKLLLPATGVYRLTGAQLVAAGMTANPQSTSLRCFAGDWLPLPPENNKPRPQLAELAIDVRDGGDGTFNSTDTLYFFGAGADRFVYDSLGRGRFVANPYTGQTVVWVALGGTYGTAPQRIQSRAADPMAIPETTITSTTRYAHAGGNLLLRRLNSGEVEDYYTWYWSNARNFQFFAATPGYLPGEIAQLYLRGKTFDTAGLGPTSGFIDVSLNGAQLTDKFCTIDSCLYQTDGLVNGLNDFRLTIYPISYTAGYFDYIDIAYPGTLLPQGNELDFVMTPSPRTANFVVTDNFSGFVNLWDISNLHAPVRLTGAVRQSAQVRFSSALNPLAHSRYFITTPNNFQTPASIQQVSPVDLYTPSGQRDLVIVAPRQFHSAVQQYVDYRAGSGKTILLVAIEDVMDNFAFGMYDPTALRDYLKFAYENFPSPTPQDVLLVGDGTYDFRNYTGANAPNFIPPYVHQLDESVSDDNYVYFGAYGLIDSDTSYLAGDRGIDMVASRWPVGSGNEVRIVLDKIKAYESTSSFGNWRTNITLVADDEFGRDAGEAFHTVQTELLANTRVPESFNQDKVYLFDFPFVGSRKPAVNDRLVRTVNDGTLLINYVGHGNPELWSDEFIFTRSGDLPRLSNAGRLPLFFTASCAIGFFDDPSRKGMAEDLLTMQGSGGIGVVSATRLVYSSANSQFNQKVFESLLYEDSLTIAEAVYVAKLLRQYASSTPPDPVANDRAYCYFGDPLVRLGIPAMHVELDTIPDSLTALGVTRLTGRVVDDQGATITGNGTLTVTLYDSRRPQLYTVAISQQEVEYDVAGARLYEGTVPVTGGRFQAQFVSPLDITFGGSGARLSLYATAGGVDAVGTIDSLPVAGTLGSIADSVPPSIEVGFTGVESFQEGSIIRPDAELRLALADSSGINLTSGLGHELTLEIDGDTDTKRVLTESFQYRPGSFTTGDVTAPLEGLTAGRHTFRVTAWDNANNVALREFTAEVRESSSLAIHDLLNYPNPMQGTTAFSFLLTQPAREMSLEIFTLSGRKIYSTQLNGPLEARRYENALVWDGRDLHAGDRVATGVYIFKATAYPQSGGASAESFGKVVVIN